MCTNLISLKEICSAGSKDGCIKLWKISKNYTVLQPLYSIPMVGRFQVIFIYMKISCADPIWIFGDGEGFGIGVSEHYLPPLPCTSEHRNMITFLRLWFLFFNIHVINETHQHASNFPLYIGWFCEQPGLFTWWTGVGGRNWSGTQTRSVVANQRGQKRDKDHQVKEKRRLIKGRDSDFFWKTLSIKFIWIF